VEKHVLPSSASYVTSSYTKSFLRSEKNKSAAQIIQTNPPEKAAIFLTFLSSDKFDKEMVRGFLLENIEKFDSGKSSYSTFFRKLACRYDRFVFGWDEISTKPSTKTV
jgi:hypothetical protein